MGAHVFLRCRQQRRIETIINGFSDGLHARVPGPQGRKDLRFTHEPVREIPAEKGAGIVDLWPVRRQKPRTDRARAAARERRSTERDCRRGSSDHHAAAEHDEIAREGGAARRVPEREGDPVEVTGRVQRGRGFVTGDHQIAVAERCQRNGIPFVFTGPRQLGECRRGMSRRAIAGAPLAWSGCPCVTRTVSRRACRALRARVEIGQVLRLADTGIDERPAG